MTYKLGSLFDGSGGFPLAGSLCGITPEWASEVEPYPIAVTRSRFPTMKHLGDISKINGGEIEPVDIITFGSPCQDLSVAGKRAGLKHEDNGDEETTRSGLFMEAVRIIKEMRRATNGRYPTFALWENVPGAFSSNKGEDFRVVLEELIKIVEPTCKVPPMPKGGWPYADAYMGDGWSLAYRVFDAQYWGVPQRRRRIHLVLDLRGERAGAVLAQREGLRGYFAEGRTPWQATTGDAQNCAGADDREGIGLDLYNLAVSGDIAVSLTANTGTSGTHVGPTVAIPYTLKIRSGCEGGGKGALIQTDKSATLSTLNDQYLFQPIGAFNQLSQSAVYKQDDKSVSLTVCGGSNGGGSECLICETIPIHDQATRFSGKRGDKSDGKGNGLGVGEPGDPMNTLTSGDRHAVAYSMKSIARNGVPLCEQANPICASDYKDPDIVAYPAAYLASGKETVGTLMANAGTKLWLGNQEAFSGDYHIIEEQKMPAARYIVRRLTPTECARLQGFADRWGDIEPKEDLTEEEYRFWLEVRNTHATVIGGKEAKEYTKEQMLTWYNKLHTDSAEYKMWGNGIALPPALYVMQGIMDALKGGGNHEEW